jgi:hypothetical protein
LLNSVKWDIFLAINSQPLSQQDQHLAVRSADYSPLFLQKATKPGIFFIKTVLIIAHISANYCYKWCTFCVKTVLIIATNGVHSMLKQC